MLHLTAKHEFDIKSLIYLRQEVTKRFQKETKQIELVWNNRNLNALRNRIEKMYEKGITVRALRFTLSESITDDTSFPSNSKHNSRLDLVCCYLGYEDFIDFQSQQHEIINSLILTSQSIDFFQRKTRTIISKTTYVTVNSAFQAPFPISSIEKNDILNALVYYAAHDNQIFSVLVKLYPKRKEIDLRFTESQRSGLKNSKTYKGVYEWKEKKYLFVEVRMENEGEMQVFFQGYIQKQQQFNWFLGTFNAVSKHFGENICGVGIVELIENQEEAIRRFDNPIEVRIQNFLKNKYFETPHKAWHSLDDLLQGGQHL